MQGVKHYLIDELEPENSFHVVEFQKMAKKAMEEIYAKRENSDFSRRNRILYSGKL